MNVEGIDWGGDGPDLLFVHPTGFPAGFFEPIALQLCDAYRVVGVDLRGHGASDKPPPDSGLYTYELMVEDVIAFLDRLGIDTVQAVGQSLGGGVSVIVDRVQPGRITKLVLAEGIAHPYTSRPEGHEDNFMATIARKRRPVWPSREAMIESYGSRPPMNELAPEALEAYIRYGTVERDDGQVELACPPAVEAAVFEAAGAPHGAHAAWEHLPSLHADAVVLAGTRSDLPQDWFRDQASRASAPFVAVEGGHFFLQEDTDRAVALLRAHLG